MCVGKGTDLSLVMMNVVWGCGLGRFGGGFRVIWGTDVGGWGVMECGLSTDLL